jgi:hypothetical protein
MQPIAYSEIQILHITFLPPVISFSRSTYDPRQSLLNGDQNLRIQDPALDASTIKLAASEALPILTLSLLPPHFRISSPPALEHSIR